MKTKLLALLIDLLLDCFTVVIGPDDGPGVLVSTIPELAAALLREDEHSDETAHSVDIMPIDGAGIRSEDSEGTRAIAPAVR